MVGIEKCLECDVSWIGEYAAVVISRRHQNIAIIAPEVAPAVLHQPVLFTIHCSITNDQNGVIKLIFFTSTANMIDFVISSIFKKIRNIQILGRLIIFSEKLKKIQKYSPFWFKVDTM